MIITTRINAKEVQNGNTKFAAFTAKIGENWFKIKFINECEKAPKTKGVYNLTFDTKNSSIQKGKKFKRDDGSEGVGNDIIWIRKIEKVVKYTDEELAEMNAKDVENAIGGFTTVGTDEELPF